MTNGSETPTVFIGIERHLQCLLFTVDIYSTVTEIAEAFEYLIGAEWATGSVLTVDGGLSLGITNA